MTATRSSEPVFVSQIELARDLNLNDRRVRQLVDERVLPPARPEGHDLELSRQRYRLFSSGSEREWDLCFDEAEDIARIAGELDKRAFEDDAGLEDVKAASIAIQRSTVLMSFLTACKSKSDAERKMFWNIWDREEGQALSALLAHAMKLMGKTHLRTDDAELIEMVPPEERIAKKRPRPKKKRGRAKASTRRR
ncbi:hypothetical protein CT676_35960 [Bradyrhizobium sp. MOS001]|uniref:hypothetical protein n=1 Tax=Bradyrhizobium sp. MOS001 TaxID=2133948 RepID=UPI0010750B45|nr:hypothetical protein [Bradyrhizobium sp. MOS001]TFW56256.1 hypothetical protein CT676_35960 [Bradyrhizobium sp. MOS001]